MNNDYSSEQLDSIIQDNMGLVVSIAKSFGPKNENELDEYVQLARIGAWKGIKKHDASRSKLGTTIWNFAKYEILRYITKEKRHLGNYQLTECLHGNSVEIQPWEILPETLSVDEKDVLKLWFQGFKFSEINTKLSRPRGWSNRTFRSAIEKIQNANP